MPPMPHATRPTARHALLAAGAPAVCSASGAAQWLAVDGKNVTINPRVAE